MGLGNLSPAGDGRDSGRRAQPGTHPLIHRSCRDLMRRSASFSYALCVACEWRGRVCAPREATCSKKAARRE